MGLTRLGALISRSNVRNDGGEYGIDDVRGMSVEKKFIPTKADMRGVSLRPYKVVRPKWFSYVTVTSRNSGKLTLAYNDSGETYLVSGTYEVFSVANENQLDPRYLFLLINRGEFDRLARFNSWGSARETLSWEDFCDVELDLPPIEIQRKYAAIYESMLANQRSYEQGLNDLKTSCDALVEKLIREVPSGPIGPYIEQSDDRNSRGFGKDAVRGLSIDKQLIQTKAKLDGVSLSGYKVVEPDYLAYVPVTSRNGGKISVALNDTDETFITSSINTVFRVREEARSQLLPAYLMLFFGRTEFDRYARFCSWGSARETFGWDEMCDVRIPLSDVSTQRCVVGLYQAWRTRSEINKRLKSQLKEIAPVLIRGSIEEASR